MKKIIYILLVLGVCVECATQNQIFDDKPYKRITYTQTYVEKITYTNDTTRVYIKPEEDWRKALKRYDKEKRKSRRK